MTDEERNQLSRIEIRTPEDFEARLEANPSPVLVPLSTATGIPERRLAELLSDSLKKRKEQLERNRSKNWLDLLIVAIAVAIAFLVIRPWWFPPKPETVVRAAEDIPAFTVITDKQLQVEGPATPSEQAVKEPFVGKYSPDLIRKDSTLPNKIAAYQKTSFSGRMIIRLEIKSFPSLEGRAYPQKVELVFASKNSGPFGTIVPALLLASDATSHVATVALLPHDAQLATAWIGSSDVNLVWRSP